MIDDVINGAPALLAVPLAFVLRRQLTSSKTVDQHTIQIDNQESRMTRQDIKFEKMCDKLEKVTNEMHELIGTLREHLQHQKDGN